MSAEAAARFAQKVRSLGLRADEFAVIGGGALALRGLREARDVDVVVRADAFERLRSEGRASDVRYREKWGRERLRRDEFEVYPDLFLNAEQRFIDVNELIAGAELINGVPCVPLECLRAFKSGPGASEKDREDVALIDARVGR